MDADDALDVLDDLTEHKKQELVSHLDEDAQKDIRKLLSYDEDEIGSCMTNNFVCISDKFVPFAKPCVHSFDRLVNMTIFPPFTLWIRMRNL